MRNMHTWLWDPAIEYLGMRIVLDSGDNHHAHRSELVPLAQQQQLIECQNLLEEVVGKLASHHANTPGVINVPL